MRRVIGFFRLDDDNPFTGRHMLALVGLFFGVVIGVNAVMATIAAGTFPGLTVRNSYVASQNYNAILAAGRAQEEAGWRAALTVEDGILRLALADAAGPRRGLDVSARIGRPATSREDRLVRLAATGSGYAADEPLPPGRWEADVEARQGGALVFRHRQEIFVAAPEAPR